jgi:hypothetical protein
MNKAELLELLGIQNRQFQRYCAGLGLSPSLESYDDESVEKLTQLRKLITEKKPFNQAVATVTGQPINQQQDNLGSTLAGRYAKELNKMAPVVAGALIEAFDIAVMESFQQQLRKSKPSIFESFAESFNYSLSGDDVLDALLLEGGDDE